MKKLLALIAGIMLVFATPTMAQAAVIDLPAVVTITPNPADASTSPIVTVEVTVTNNTGAAKPVGLRLRANGLTASQLKYQSCNITPSPGVSWGCGEYVTSPSLEFGYSSPSLAAGASRTFTTTFKVYQYTPIGTYQMEYWAVSGSDTGPVTDTPDLELN
jgi:hypothetical protein